MAIKGAENLSATELNMELQKGARFVVYQYCISLIIITFRRGSGIYFIRADESAVNKGLPYILITVLCGWWGIPWGPIFTIQALATNIRGGKDVTQQVIRSLNQPMA